MFIGILFTNNAQTNPKLNPNTNTNLRVGRYGRHYQWHQL